MKDTIEERIVNLHKQKDKLAEICLRGAMFLQKYRLRNYCHFCVVDGQGPDCVNEPKGCTLLWQILKEMLGGWSYQKTTKAPSENAESLYLLGSGERI